MADERTIEVSGCTQCPFRPAGSDYCRLDGKTLDGWTMAALDYRPPWCPLPIRVKAKDRDD